MLPGDTLCNVLYIDLGKKSYRIEKRPALFEAGIGGAGVAIRLLAEECPAGCDPFSPDNPVVFAVGPLTGLFPLASKTVAMFKSPLSGNLGESHCGGRSAVAIRLAGYGAMVIKGASETPIYLAVHGDKVYFRNAATLWGMDNLFTAGQIIRGREPSPGTRTIMRIGRAGEKMIPFAGVTTETYRHFGRLGLGAVFGSKKLKAVVVSGARSLPTKDVKEYRKIYEQIHKAAVESEVMRKYHDLGTAENVLPLNVIGGLPTRNLKDSRFEGAETMSGESFAGKYLGRRLACSHCPVGCIHIAALREPDEREAFFYKTSMICYDYEPIYALGTMLGISDPEGFLKLMHKVETTGLDVMSTGVVLAWATEALERGLITEETMGWLRLSWGDYKAYIEAVEKIVEQPNDFFKALAGGVEHASAIYGGSEFALSYGGNEMAGYHTGPAAHLGLLLGARHSHLDNAGYSVDQKIVMKKQTTPREIVDRIFEEEQWRQVLSSLVICFFARGIYTPEVVSETLGSAGFALSPDELSSIGKKIHFEKYAFKFREGFKLQEERLPGRIFETMSSAGRIDADFMKQAVEYAESVLGAAGAEESK